MAKAFGLMPATLGHFAVHYVVTKGLLPRADVKWILAGCVIPDLPWIAQRVLGGITDLPPVPLRLYFIAQSSLIVSVLLCLALALLSKPVRITFITLTLGVLLHLLLDATQIKWANGVLLFAPIDWQLTGFWLFWPEDWPTAFLFATGFAAVIWMVFTKSPDAGDLIWPKGLRLWAAVASLLLYVWTPFAMMPAVLAANLHDTATIEDDAVRTGKPVSIDRGRIVWDGDTPTLRAWFGEEIVLIGPVPVGAARASLRGTFAHSDRILVVDAHAHPAVRRNFATILGLGFVLSWWAAAIWRRWRG